MDRKLLEYLPPVLRTVREYGAITGAEQPEAEATWGGADAALNNQFVPTAMDYGLTRWEGMLGITAQKGESLSFRRDRLLNRMNLRDPFTLGWLYGRLNALLGPGKWTVEMDYANYTLYIEADIQNQSYVQEVSVTLNTVKPCNIVYINRPLVPDGLRVSEGIRLSSLEYNCRQGVWALGVRPFLWEAGNDYHYYQGSWALGEAPFAHEDEKGVVKLTSQSSVQPALTDDVTGFLRGHVAAARINGKIVLNALTKAVYGSQLVVTYLVSEAQTDTVTKIELLDAEGITLCSAVVLVPVAGSVMLKHTIMTKEGS